MRPSYLNRDKQPPLLVQGDTVGILSTARSVEKKQLYDASKFLENLGLTVRLGSTIGLFEHQMAGTDAQRAEDFQAMLDDPEIKAIWCAKGGYGTVRIIDQLDFSKFLQNPKWIIGYSDVTVMHNHVHNLGIATLHAQMAVGFEKVSASAKESLKKALFGESLNHTIPTCNLNRLGTAEGILVGGNLSILYSLCGSASALNTAGKILFIEDLDEYLYHIDRMMMNLKRNGMLQNLAGLIVGGMTQMNDNAVPFGKTTEEIILNAVQEYDYPVCFDFPAGHVVDNRTLILGRKAQLQITSEIVELNFDH
ncbi:MAG: LD-carboxypeptidase [Leeuwenhoekiella sp.]